MKLIRAFGFLKFAPFLIPFRAALSGVPTRQRLPLAALLAYFGALVIVSFATNSRSTFADAIPTVAMCLLVAKAYGYVDLRRVSPISIVVWIVCAVLAGLLLSRVALAMVVVREYRLSAGIETLIRLTIEALFNSEWLEIAKSKMDTAVGFANYSEVYVDSRFFARFLLTKFHDNILYFFSLMGPDQLVAYREFMEARLLGTLPDPFLRMLGIAINKQDLVISNGDYTVYLVDGWGLGQFKTGSMVGEVFSVFGWAAALVAIVCALMLFVFHDAFVRPAATGGVVIAPMMLLLLWNLCGTTAAFGLGAESVTAIPAGIVRGLPQNLLIYLIAITLLGGTKPRRYGAAPVSIGQLRRR